MLSFDDHHRMNKSATKREHLLTNVPSKDDKSAKLHRTKKKRRIFFCLKSNENDKMLPS